MTYVCLIAMFRRNCGNNQVHNHTSPALTNLFPNALSKSVYVSSTMMIGECEKSAAHSKQRVSSENGLSRSVQKIYYEIKDLAGSIWTVQTFLDGRRTV